MVAIKSPSTPKLYIPPKLAPLFQPAKFKSIRGGRGSAKSHSVATYLLLEGVKRKHRFLCAREFQNSISESVLSLLADKISDLNFGAFYTVQRNTILAKNGTEFIFSGLKNNIDSIKSMEGITKTWIEEGQGVSEDTWRKLLPTIFRTDGAECIITWNPENETDPTYERFVIHPPDDCVSIEINYLDNPFFPKELDELRLNDKERLPLEDYEWIWLGRCRKLAGSLIFRDKVIVEDFETPPKARFYAGLDHGYANDPLSFVRCWIRDQDLFIDHEIYGRGIEIDEIPALLAKVPDVKRLLIYGDSARPESNPYLRNKGYNVISAAKWPGSVDDGIAFLRAFRKIHIHTQCPNTAEDFRRMAWKVDKRTGEILPVPASGWDHAPDATRYAVGPLIKETETSPEEWALLSR